MTGSLDVDLSVEALGAEHIDDILALFAHTWWTETRSRDDVARMLAHTPVLVGLRDPRDGRLVAFARGFTDTVYKALLMDVVVDPHERGQGVGAHLVRSFLDHPLVAGVGSVELYCHPDRERFYRELGFSVAVVGGGDGAGAIQTLMRR